MLPLHQLLGGHVGEALHHVHLRRDHFAVQDEGGAERLEGVDHRPVGWVQVNSISSARDGPTRIPCFLFPNRI
jgi:hypothetical protein